MSDILNVEHDYMAIEARMSKWELDELDPGLRGLLGDADQMKNLSNHDYSLNSPLIADELDGIINWLKHNTPSIFMKPTWHIVRGMIPKKDLMDTKIMMSKEIPAWFGKRNLRSSYNRSEQFAQLTRDVKRDADKTRPVVDAFIKGWLGEFDCSSFPDKLNIPAHGTKYGHLFWDLHIMTLMLNCTTIVEGNHLVETFPAEMTVYDGKITFMFRSSNYGNVRIGGGFVFMQSEKGLFDRNTIMMMKDVYIARYNTFLSTKNRVDTIFPANFDKDLNTFYQLGDTVLTEGGNGGYTSLKLVESMCNNKLVKMAQKHRPLIPEFPDFNKHIEESVQNRSIFTPSIGKLNNHINVATNVEAVLTYYGSFRHWGHPYINYLEGLRKLHNQVTMPKSIDKKYAETLASDLAYMVIKDQFKKKKSWPVDLSKMNYRDDLYKFIEDKTWPNNSVIKNYGPNWHKLPLSKCFDIPDVIEPSLLYSDKSHSMTMTELKAYISDPRRKPQIPTRKVLSTLLNSPATNWPEFLKRVNDEGISLDQLLIGLKCKEREMKEEGRFFSLMSWEIRDYIVMTEYLIKTHFVPLFKGLTMADDLTTVIEKMLSNTEGQGSDDYAEISIADHIDYEKWNNHQRPEGNNPVFRVMGQFLGYPNLIERTHEIFQKSLIYYVGRSDLMEIGERGKIVNVPNAKVCWDGQDGGLEGLRQKGWSICNLLVLQRESNSVNTLIKTLAQGDNQVICSSYKLRPYRTERQLKDNIADICRNNKKLMERVSIGTSKLGLIINQDETMKSTEFLNYSKYCIIRGNLRNLETKRWSRVTCVTNDQLPTMANILSTTSSNALTVSHFSDSPINTMYHYNFIAHFVRKVCETHNPAIRGPVKSIMGLKKDELSSLRYLVAVLYLDPSIGGVCGMSLTRFIVRAFPDPITESLSFLKIIYDNTDNKELKEIVKSFGHPLVKAEKNPDITKLIEDPLSLNIYRGIDAVTMIKDQIKQSLLKGSAEIKNNLIRDAVTYQRSYESTFNQHLKQIEPLFPRFLSEYRAATYFGITDSLTELFQNSKTIRNQFRRDLSVKYDEIIIKSELYSLQVLLGIRVSHQSDAKIWTCSSTQADSLRLRSWGAKVHGATIPHPCELFGRPTRTGLTCGSCFLPLPHRLFISILIPEGFDRLKDKRGTCTPYLGSSTLESTSVLRSWERETKIPMLKRAADLRSAINWFILPDSNLAKSIINNLQALTGQDWSKSSLGFKRTGSALHRFHCSRQSSGGYAAQNPSKLSRMLSTTNHLSDLGDQNYDFMFQNCILNALMTVGEIHAHVSGQGYYHQHISCSNCLRPIDEVVLDSPAEFVHIDVHESLKRWKPEGVEWSVSIPTISILASDWTILSHAEKSHHVGVMQGFIYGDSTWGSTRNVSNNQFFPNNFGKKLIPRSYLRGLMIGVIRGSMISIIHQKRLEKMENYYQHILGHSSLTLDRLCEHPGLLNIWRSPAFVVVFASISHSIPSKFPMSDDMVKTLGKNYLKHLLLCIGKKFLEGVVTDPDKRIWIFADFYRFEIIALLGISEKCRRIFQKSALKKKNREELNQYRYLSTQVRDLQNHQDIEVQEIRSLLGPLRYVDQEMRFAVKMGIERDDTEINFVDLKWGKEFVTESINIEVVYGPEQNYIDIDGIDKMRFQNPLISGLRTAQLATGSHYKLRGILSSLKLNVGLALCGGDGSGGISALVLRMYPLSTVFFNSLCTFDGVHLKGVAPAPPSAILHTLKDHTRCPNMFSCWTEPNDLRNDATWVHFMTMISRYTTEKLDLLILDMEVTDLESIKKIEINLLKWYGKICKPGGTIIFKSYLTRLFAEHPNLLDYAGDYFTSVQVVTTGLSSSQTSEVYIILRGASQRKSVYSNLYVNYHDLYSLCKDFPLFSSRLTEFKRAQRVKDVDLSMGVPKVLLPNPVSELMNTLSFLGLRSDLSYTYASNLGFSRQLSFVPMDLFILVINGIIPFTSGTESLQSVPSDGVVVNLAIWVTGFVIWAGYSVKSYIISNAGQKLIDNFFPFEFRSKRKKGLSFSQWSITDKLDISKHIQLDSKLAAIGSVIRTLRLNFMIADKFQPTEHTNSICKSYNRAVTRGLFNEMTGIIDWLKGKDDLSTCVTPKISLMEETKEKLYELSALRD